jgi:hypothetical protein
LELGEPIGNILKNNENFEKFNTHNPPQSEVLLGTCWESHLELGEPIGNILKNNENFEKFNTHNPPQKEKQIELLGCMFVHFIGLAKKNLYLHFFLSFMVNGRDVNYDTTLCFVSGQSIWDNVTCCWEHVGKHIWELGEHVGNLVITG